MSLQTKRRSSNAHQMVATVGCVKKPAFHVDRLRTQNPVHSAHAHDILQGLPATSSSHVLTAAGFIQFNQQLGHGSFKAVYKGYDEEEGIEVAWCQVNMDRVGEAEKAQIQTEVDILKSLDHKVRHTACQKKGIFPAGRVHLRHRCEGTRGPSGQ